MMPLKNGFSAAQILSFAACEPIFTGYAKLSPYLGCLLGHAVFLEFLLRGNALDGINAR
jgi:hypothetical protein